MSRTNCSVAYIKIRHLLNSFCNRSKNFNSFLKIQIRERILRKKTTIKIWLPLEILLENQNFVAFKVLHSIISNNMFRIKQSLYAIFLFNFCILKYRIWLTRLFFGNVLIEWKRAIDCYFLIGSLIQNIWLIISNLVVVF